MSLIEVDLNPPKAKLRVFGVAGFVVLAGLGLLVYFTGGLPFWKFQSVAAVVAVVLLVAAVLSGLFALIAPSLNRPLWVALVLLSLPIGFIVSYAVLVVVFFGLITPIGLGFRLVGRDALKRRFEPGARTYWEPHNAPAQTAQYFSQF